LLSSEREKEREMFAEMLPWDGCVSFPVLSFSLNSTNLIFSHIISFLSLQH